MVIDCESCAVRGPACGDCVVSVLLGVPSPARPHAVDDPAVISLPLDLGVDDHRAIDALADAGMVPRLRLVSTRGVPTQRTSPRRAG